MKKYFLLLIPLFLVLLTGCNSGGEKETICSVHTTNGQYSFDLKYTIVYKEDIVNKLIFKEIYETEDDNTADQIEKTITDTYMTAKKVFGGYTVNISRDGNKTIADVEIDYTKINTEKLFEATPEMKNYYDGDHLSYNKIKTYYESAGMTCN